MTTRIGAGFRVIHYGLTDTNGYLVGGTEAAAAGNTNGKGMVRLYGAQTINTAVPEPTRVTVSGDDSPMVTFDFEAEELPGGALELAARTNDFEAFVQGSLVEEIDDLEVGVLQPGGGEPQPVVLLLSRRAKKWTAASKAWENLVIPAATVTPLGGDYQQRTATPYRYSISTSKTSRTPWGKLFSALANGATSAPIIPIDSDNPVMMHAFKGDNAETDFILTYTPISLDKTSVFVNGVKLAQADYALNTSTKTVTFDVAPATDALIVVLYEYDASEIA